ncbi:heterokaryon incompatibility protein-domain-containing protein [Bisporella sp. PMI_857]|nr:heterokaryon incompatibility protein-domain-containing protein [Bisporella sp. PMI_857]
MASPTHYKPLDSSTSSIRLIRLHHRLYPLTPDQYAIECTFFTADLASSPSYEALSYEWGPANPPKGSFPVLLNGVPREIQENLWWALFHLRTTKPRALWIDALCINQDDVEERNYQVGLMEQIYRKAWKTLIWLGREHEDLGADFSSDRETFTYLGKLGELHQAGAGKLVTLEWVMEERSLNGVAALLGRSYWHRVWIIQEILLSSEKSLHIGPLVLSWDTLINVCEILQKISWWCSPMRYVAGTVICCNLKVYRETGMHWLLEYTDAECQDSRDRIFGIRSMMRNCCQDALPVDYSLSAQEIFMRLLKHEMQMHEMNQIQHNYANALALWRSFGITVPSTTQWATRQVILRKIRYWPRTWVFLFMRFADRSLDSELKNVAADQSEAHDIRQPIVDSAGKAIRDHVTAFRAWKKLQIENPPDVPRRKTPKTEAPKGLRLMTKRPRFMTSVLTLSIISHNIKRG